MVQVQDLSTIKHSLYNQFVKKKLLTLIPLLVLFLAAFMAQNNSQKSSPEQVSGEKTNAFQTTVTDVKDGDTITLKNGETVRYIGINTPEKGQPYGDEATKENRQLVLGKEVTLEYDKALKDQYNRTLAYVYVGEVFVNKHLVEQGLALTETVPPNEKHEGTFLEAEAKAQSNCLGLWDGLCSQSKNSCVVITDIHFDAEGNDTTNKNDEWITFQNICDYEISLTNYTLKDRSASNAYIFKDTMLYPQQFLRLHSGCGQDSSNDLYWQCPEKRSAVWNNETDHAFLYDDNNILVTHFGY